MKRIIFSLGVMIFIIMSLSLYAQNVIPRDVSHGFIEEKGQNKTFDNLQFYWHQNNIFVYFLPDRAVFIAKEIIYEDNENSLSAAANGDDNLAKKLSSITVASRFDLVFVNSNKDVKVAGENVNLFKLDYYLAHCPDGILNVASFNKIRYCNIYPDIDLVFSFDGQGLKYEFDVKPGGNPSNINLRWDGLKNLHLNKNNELQFSVGSFDFTDKAPVSYCGDYNVTTKYILEGNNIKFDVADYDNSKTLVIDPTLNWASSLEYNGYGTWGGLVTNSAGQFYIVDWEWNPGSTDVMNYLNSAGTMNQYSSDATNFDIMISKFSKAGVLLWACRYGSTREDDISGAVTLDDNDNLFIAGKTFSQGDFPLQILTGAYNQAYNGTCSGTRGYLLKFGPTNTRLWATYIDNGANFEPFDIACGLNNDIYICGKSGSTLSCTGITIPTGTGYLGNYTSVGASHNFILRFNSSGALTWSTWLPGTTNSTGRVCDIAIDKSNGDVFLVGDDLWSATYTFSAALISAPMTFMGQDDMFYMKFNASNNAVPAYGKYFGGAGFDKINIGAANGDIELDASGNLYACGHTYSANFPLSNPGGCTYYDGTINDGTGITANVASTQDGYLFKVNSSGTMSYSTFFGGTGYTSMKQLKKDTHNNLWICGHQTAAGLATISHADYYNNAITGVSNNIMFAQLGTNDNMEWLSYYGFTGYSEYNGFDIWEPTTDSAYLYLSGNFNVISNTGGGYQWVSGSSCSGAAEFCNQLSSAPFSISGSTSLCGGATTPWTSTSPGGTWSSSNNGVFTVNSVSGLVTGVSGGTADITYSLTISSCVFTASASIIVTSAASIASVTGATPLCIGGNATYSANSVVLGGGAGAWSSSDIGIATVNSSGLVTGVATGNCNIIYTVTGGCGGTVSAQQSVAVSPVASVASVNGTTPICIGNTASYTANSVVLGGGAGAWNSSDIAIATVNASGLVTGVGTGNCNIIYTITGGCGGTVSAQQSVAVSPAASVASVSGTTQLCIGNTASYTANSVVLGGGTGAWNSSDIAIATVNASGLVTGAGTGSCNIIYTITGGCGGTVSQQLAVTVYGNLSGGNVAANQTICYNENVSAFSNVVLPSGGSGSYGYQWQIQPGCSGAWSDISGANSSNYSHPTSLTQTTCFIRQVIDLCGTAYSDTINIAVNPLPNVSFTGLATYYCMSNDTIILTGIPTGGTFTGNGITDSIFYPMQAGVGNHSITYTYTDANSCTDSETQIVEVKGMSVVNFSGLDTAYCMGDPVAQLTGNPTGGTFTGTGISGTTFNPSTAGAGTHTVTYTYINSYLCVDSISQNVVVNDVPIVTFDSLTSLCFNNFPIMLNTGMPLGGTYSGIGVANNIFDPGIAGVGQHPITYTYSNVYGCSDSVTDSIEVYSSPVVTLPLFDNLCATGLAITLSGGNPSGGNYSGDYIVNNVFDPSVAGAGPHTFIYVFTNNLGCSDTATGTIEVVPDVTLSSDATGNSVYVELGQVVNFTTIPANQGNYVYYIDTTEMQSGTSNLYTTNILETSNTVYVVLNNACSDSLIINVKPVSNAFVPFNADGKNDVFMPNVDLTIINRWGQELYKGTEGWDGKYKDQNASPGTYFYIIKVAGLDGEEKFFKGSVTLIEK